MSDPSTDGERNPGLSMYQQKEAHLQKPIEMELIYTPHIETSFMLNNNNNGKGNGQVKIQKTDKSLFLFYIRLFKKKFTTSTYLPVASYQQQTETN